MNTTTYFFANGKRLWRIRLYRHKTVEIYKKEKSELLRCEKKNELNSLNVRNRFYK